LLGKENKNQTLFALLEYLVHNGTFRTVSGRRRRRKRKKEKKNQKFAL
jgi:hypothetical protein